MFPDKNATFLVYFRAINLILFCYSFSNSTFPIFTGLKNKTNNNMISIAAMTSTIATIIYIFVSCFAITLFGRDVTLDSNLSLNIINESNVLFENSPDQISLRVLYLLMQICYFPNGFFTGKEALLIIIDELHRKSVSRCLNERIKALNGEKSTINDSTYSDKPVVTEPDKSLGNLSDSSRPFHSEKQNVGGK